MKQTKNKNKDKEAGSIEDIKATMQASIEKKSSLHRVDAKSLSYVKNCFQMADQEPLELSGSRGGLLRKQFKGFTVFPLYFIVVAADVWLCFL